MTTHYETLGIDKTASTAEIKKTYRKLAAKWHPDRPKGDTARFQQIQAAYDVLSDESKKAKYDAELSGHTPRFNFNFNNSGMSAEDNINIDLSELLRRQFNNVHFSNTPKPKNRDVRVTVTMPLVDTLYEQEKTLRIVTPGNKEDTVTITIPRGISTGDTMRYPHLGSHAISSEPRSDLLVNFIVENNDNFLPLGIDLVTTLTINCIDAMLGCTKTVESLDGAKFNLTIPPGTQYGTKFGIPNKGLFEQASDKRGRLIITVEITIPQNLTTEQTEMLKTFTSKATTKQQLIDNTVFFC